ncbi:MAG TPA: RnfABCDGE type electron transport complex subunit G [Thermodesulfovibrionales bacterium]|nr:RnfABCDGE type electron transport complex subunit G [Thermodesulfovibrionales bacterium]
MTAKDIIKIALNLVVIYVIGGLILAAVYAKTSPIMYRNAEEQKKQALKQLIPDADKIEKLGDWSIHDKHAEYFIARKGDETIGYIVQSYGKGYSSYINTLIAVDKDFKVQKINILSHAETPGLGDEIEADSFKGQFKNKDLDHLKVLKTDTTEYIQAISGATISSRAVTEDAVKNGVKFLMEKVKEGGSESGAAKHG